MIYKKRLEASIEENRRFQAEQKELRERYGVKEDGVIRVVRKRFLEIVIKNVKDIFKTCIGILEILLASVGGISLLYPGTRMEVLELLQDLLDQAIRLIKM